MIIKEKKARVNEIIVGGAVSDSVVIMGDSNYVLNDEGQVVGRDVNLKKEKNARVFSETQAFERINTAVRVNLKSLEQNVAQARSESNQFFRLTIIFASLGFLVIAVGVVLLILNQVTAGVVSAIAGIIPEATAVLFFQKDKELRGLIESYHQHMQEYQRILTMIDVAETIKVAKERDKMKREIILRVLGIEEEVIPSKK